MDEDDLPTTGKDQIGLAWKAYIVKAIPVAKRKN